MVAVKLVAVNVVVVVAMLVPAVSKLSKEYSQWVTEPVCPLKVNTVELVPVQTVALPAMLPPTDVGETNTVRVEVAFAQPPVPVTVYVMVAVPDVTPLMAPEVASIVATPVLFELQLPPATVELKLVVPPTHIPCVPLKLPPVGAAVTVTVRVEVAFAQPPVPVTVYVMVAVPAAIPLIAPVDAFIVATPVLFELQLPPATVELKLVVPPTHIPCVPLKVPAVGAAVTVSGISIVLALLA